jgi:hypothetical protein
VSGSELPLAEELLPLVYEELRRLAAHKMAQAAPGQTLQPTALVHEAWLRLGADGQPPTMAGRVANVVRPTTEAPGQHARQPMTF